MPTSMPSGLRNSHHPRQSAENERPVSGDETARGATAASDLRSKLAVIGNRLHVLAHVKSFAVFLLFTCASLHAAPLAVDVCVYGGTSGGVIAAVEAARLGKKVVLIEPSR